MAAIFNYIESFLLKIKHLISYCLKPFGKCHMSEASNLYHCKQYIPKWDFIHDFKVLGPLWSLWNSCQLLLYNFLEVYYFKNSMKLTNTSCFIIIKLEVFSTFTICSTISSCTSCSTFTFFSTITSCTSWTG